ncbi:MAG: hypothetical protein NUW23_08930, partial [Firmicutes bacterium]|nr:hypothetical protein [Bacillota bacterium]
ALVFVDSTGESLRIERTPRGLTQQSAALISRVTGNMSKTLYSNIFAFGLQELSELSSLESDEVRSRIYSAGAGLGTRTLPSAQQVIKSQLDRAFKPSGKVPIINALEATVTSIQKDLHALEADPEAYNHLIAEIERVGEEVKSAREDLRAATEQETWAASLKNTRPVWESLVAVRARLADASVQNAACAPGTDLILDYATEIEAASEGRKAHVELLPELPGLAAAATEKDRLFMESLARLGPGWDADNLDRFDASPGAYEAIRTFRERAADLKARRSHLSALAVSKADAVSAARKRKEELSREIASMPAPAHRCRDDVVRRLKDLERLESILRSVEILEARVDAARDRLWDSKRREGDIARQRKTGGEGPPRWLGAFGPLLGIAAGVAAAWGRPPVVAGLAIALGGVLAAVLAWLAWGLSRREAGRAQALALSHSDAATLVEEHRAALNRAEAVLAEQRAAAAALGRSLFGDRQVDMGAVLQARQAAEADRQLWDKLSDLKAQLVQAEREAESRASEAESARVDLEAVDRELASAEAKWRTWLQERGIDPSFGYDGAQATLDSVRDALRRREDAQGAKQALDVARERVGSYTRQVNEILRALGREATEPDRSGEAVAGLVREVCEARERVRDRTALATRERELAAQLEAAFPAESRGRMEQEQSSHTKEEVEAEFESAKNHRERLGEILEDKTRELAQLEERRLAMERKDELASGLARLHAAELELASEVRQWAVWSVCQELLDRACDRYERDRQPGVLRRASSAFATMTAGRYPSIIAPLTGNLGSMEAVDLNGRRLAPIRLSHGTEQQLYLSVRCGLVREYCSRTESLPVIVDDILVNFDPVRARAAAEVLAGISEVCQILVFTCHPETAEDFRRTGRVTSEFTVDGGAVSPVRGPGPPA